MSDKKYHWVCFSFVFDGGHGDVSLGLGSNKISMADVSEAKRDVISRIKCKQKESQLVLINVAHLGYMTEQEFLGEDND